MDGKQSNRIDRERPIAKPNFPLPLIFSPSRRSEMPTRRGPQYGNVKQEHAHFYRKQTTESGAPIYGFYITTDESKKESTETR